MYYHHFLVTVFEDLSDSEGHRQPRPDAVVYEANRYFATLFRLYYIRHGHENMDIHIIISLIFAGIRCLDGIGQQTQESDMESLRSTLVLCATGLYNQGRNNYLAQALYSAFRSRLRPEQARLLNQIPDLQNDEEAMSLKASHTIPVDTNRHKVQ